MDYNVDTNNPNVSTTVDPIAAKDWNISKVYESEFTLDSLIETLQVIDIFKRVHPDQEVVAAFEKVVRQTICEMFGGELKNDLS